MSIARPVCSHHRSKPSELPELLVLSDVVVSAPAVVLRAKQHPIHIRQTLAELTRTHTDYLILASMIDPISDGVHLAAQDCFLKPYEGILGRSCHDLNEVRHAELEGVDYVTLSPIFASDSKPDYGPVLGLSELSRIAQETHVPIYALGGVDAGRVAACRAAGAAGVAVQGAIARSSHPETTIANLLTEWQSG